MKVPIGEIRIKEGRRSLDAAHVGELADSIRELGLLNPVTIDKDNHLIAGLHRLEAAKALGWTEIDCTVSSLGGLQAELAEIDENIVRSDISALEYGEILLRRKEIYETLHPETKHGGDRKSEGIKATKCRFETARSFAQDTAEKLGVTPRTVERQIQTAKNLSPEAKDIIRDTDTRLSKKAAMKLSRLEPEQQKEAAGLLAAKEIRTVEEYTARAEEKKQEETSQEDWKQTGREPERKGRNPKRREWEPQEITSGKETEDTTFQDTVRQGKDTAFQDMALQEEDMALQDTALQEEGMMFPGTAMQGEAEGESERYTGQACQGGGDNPLVFAASALDAQMGNNCQEVSQRESVRQEGENTSTGISFRDLVAELKDPDKDCSGTPESFLEEYAAFVRKFRREIGWYNDPYYDSVYPRMDNRQLASLKEMTQAICSAAEGILQKVERMMEI